jgi:CDP-diacylglycerol--glycerol-3-phosphate 3-phosphatidyltransferase
MNLDNQSEWEIDNLPNRLTMFRMLLIPIIVGALYAILLDFKWAQGHSETLGYIAGWTFVAASVTDFLDGYIARKRGIVTVFGSFLDPIADKFLVVSSLILLQALDRIPAIIVIVLVLRELYITSLRLLARERELSVPVDKWGKWKTAAQMVGVPLLMPDATPWGIPMTLLGTIFVYIASFFSLYSALLYSKGLLVKMRQRRALKRQQRSMSS